MNLRSSRSIQVFFTFLLFHLNSTTLGGNDGINNGNIGGGDDEVINQYLRNGRNNFFDITNGGSGSDAIGSEFPNNNSIQTRVVGGTPAARNEFPSFVYLELGCGGTLISPNLVLTAAHCMAAEWRPYVWVGARTRNNVNRGTRRKVVAVGMHPLYDAFSNNYDFAVLRLEEDINSVTPITLNRDGNNPSNGDNLVTIGLGLTSDGGRVSNVLQKVNVPYVSQNNCNIRYGGKIVRETMLCAGESGRDSCQGDSGGPIMDRSTGAQVGVVSFGIGCGTSLFPGVYARLSGAIDWIDDQICLHASSANFAAAACRQKSSRKPITFQIKYDEYPDETSWNLRNNNSGKIILNAPKGDGIAGRLLSNTLNLQPGSYTFEMEDTAGDGLCCGYGNGFYKIIDNNGVAITDRNGRFATSDIVTFNVLDGGSSSTTSSNGNNQPSQPSQANSRPHDIRVDINYDLGAWQTQWKVTKIPEGIVEYISPFNSIFMPGLMTTRFYLSSGTYLFEIEDSVRNGVNWFGSWYMDSIRLYKRDASTNRDVLIARNSGRFGAYAQHEFKLE